MEIWKDIPGYEGEYEASSEGRIRTKFGKTTWSKRFQKPRIWKQRVLRQKWERRKSGLKDARVVLWHNNRGKTVLVARCVCAAFNPTDDISSLTVNHIDGNPENNKAQNLEWLTLKDNIQHGFRNSLYTSQKAITLIDAKGQSLEFRSFAAASRYLKRNIGYVSSKVAHSDNFLISHDGKTFRYLCTDNKREGVYNGRA